MLKNNKTTTDMANVADCKYCGESIAWLKSKKGTRYPVQYDGGVDQDGRAIAIKNDFHNCQVNPKNGK